MKKTLLKGTEELVIELRSRIKNEYNGTDDELKSEVENFNKMLSVRQKEIHSEENKIKQLEADELKISDKLMNEQKMLGQLFKEEELNEERVCDRNQQLVKLGSQLELNGKTKINILHSELSI